MAFSGKYELVSQENFESFMKAIGLPDELVQKGKDAKSVTEYVQDGNHFVVTSTTGAKVLRNEYTVGEEAEIETLSGEKVKTVVHLDGNKLTVNLKAVVSVTELDGDTLTNVRQHFYYMCKM
uniref:Liver-type fatty acid-binding protein n=1 Tax=Leptobrachium leishanense TaxID=445787 RepID=A0A8C5MBC7_9ANUR